MVSVENWGHFLSDCSSLLWDAVVSKFISLQPEEKSKSLSAFVSERTGFSLCHSCFSCLNKWKNFQKSGAVQGHLTFITRGTFHMWQK